MTQDLMAQVPPERIKLIMGADGPRIWWGKLDPTHLPDGEVIEYVRAASAPSPTATGSDEPKINPLKWADQGAADFTLFAAETPIGRFVYGTDNQGQPYHQDPHGEEEHATEEEAKQAAEAAHIGLVAEKLCALGVTQAAPVVPDDAVRALPSTDEIEAVIWKWLQGYDYADMTYLNVEDSSKGQRMRHSLAYDLLAALRDGGKSDA